MTTSRRVFRRSMIVLEQLLGNSRYGFNRPDLSILDVSEMNSPLSVELRRLGYSVQRMESGRSLNQPIDLVICDGPLRPGMDLPGLLQTLEPTFQVILMNVVVLGSAKDREALFNPAEIGKHRKYPIHKWYDWIWGWAEYRRLRQCPVVRIRPIQTDFRLRDTNT